MLEPTRLETGAPPPRASTFRIEGNLLDENPQIAPELVSLGADRYEAEFDPELGLLTNWAVIIDGHVALRLALTHLTPILG